MNEDSDTKYSEFNIKLLESKYALIYGIIYIHTEFYHFLFLFCYSVNLQVRATLYFQFFQLSMKSCEKLIFVSIYLSINLEISYGASTQKQHVNNFLSCNQFY